jgi:hypothetical protein
VIGHQGHDIEEMERWVWHHGAFLGKHWENAEQKGKADYFKLGS